ncbi:ferredoxin [Streptomyces mirabilis]|uniref:ferredoxin n=1 Tax=Streptomyces mirabilis TaxID=68239 RepID=UPI003D9DCDB3
MQTVVDLTRCQDYGQCVSLAPEVFQLHGEGVAVRHGRPRRPGRARAPGCGGMPGAGDPPR